MPYKDPEQQRRFQREWKAQRREEYFSDKECVRCGAAEDLRLDHLDPAKKVNHRVWSWSKARREAELAKCQVLCEDCHRKKTVANMEHAHGTSVATARLTEEDVVGTLASPDDTTRNLGARFGVDPGTIRAIRRGETWKHIPRHGVQTDGGSARSRKPVRRKAVGSSPRYSSISPESVP